MTNDQIQRLRTLHQMGATIFICRNDDFPTWYKVVRFRDVDNEIAIYFEGYIHFISLKGVRPKDVFVGAALNPFPTEMKG
ncbi:MAG: hypothetical protein KGL39_00790 [Patescibacteria group bacterium]|nr:hypothetical protein [Patescibacteria group bacterium]